MNTRKKVVILVGALALKDPKIIGGVRFACQSLLDSPLSQQVDWLLIDSAVSQNTGVLKRGFLALSRVMQFLYLLLWHPRVESVLIFGNYDLTSFAEKGCLVLLGKMFNKRTVLSIRSEVRPYSFDRWFTAFRRIVFKACSQIICQSNQAAQQLVELTNCDPLKITILMNWIDYHKYTPHNRFSTPDDEVALVTFIFVGHLTTNKGPDVLLRASRILKQNGIRFRLVICGQGPLYHELKQAIQTFNLTAEVELRGWITGELLISALWDAQVFVLPTHSEGMPNALLEAMAAGLPVISTRISSIPEIVDEGVNGFLVQPGNTEELANAMQQMASSAKTRKIIGSNNLAYVRKRHSIENAWQVVADLL